MNIVKKFDNISTNKPTNSLTQWFPVKIAFGWINEPPQMQASSSIRMIATVHGNSPKPASLSCALQINIHININKSPNGKKKFLKMIYICSNKLKINSANITYTATGCTCWCSWWRWWWRNSFISFGFINTTNIQNFFTFT